MARKTPKRCRRCDHTVNTQHEPLVGKTPKSEHNIKSPQPALSGSLLKLRNTPKLQVELPLDVVAYQILTRLPVQTLCRFRCVSKPLCSFISDPRFRKEHARLSQQTPPLLLVAEAQINGVRFSTCTIDGEQLLKDFSLSYALPDNPPSVSFKLVQSCLGLVCITTQWNGGDILVFNPSTMEVTTLPGPDQTYVLAVGFGYTDISDEFKVVRFFTRHVEGHFDDRDHNPERQKYFSEVFTLGSSDGWRETRSRPPFAPYGDSRLQLVRGALHYLPSPHYHPDKRHDHYITAFDVHTERYRLIPLPKIYSRLEFAFYMNQCQMAELRGSLCLSCYLFRSKHMLQLWFLKDYHGGKWVKECNIDFYYEDYEPLYSDSFAVTGDGYVLMSIQSSDGEYRLCYYDTQKKCIASMFVTGCSAVFYVDSFLPLPLGNRLNINHTPTMIRSTQEKAAL